MSFETNIIYYVKMVNIRFLFFSTVNILFDSITEMSDKLVTIAGMIQLNQIIFPMMVFSKSVFSDRAKMRTQKIYYECIYVEYSITTVRRLCWGHAFNGK